MRKKSALFLTAAFCFLLSGCAKEKTMDQAVVSGTAPMVEIEQETEPETEPINEQLQIRAAKDGKIESYLTGEPVEEEIAGRRPLAIMISNDRAALPHYGMSHAGVIYEVPVEGGMNRYMALIEDYDQLERIGSVRSCRTCYTYFAREFDAIYAHFGQSVFALPYLEQMEHLNGLEGKGQEIFYRSKDRKAPHNAYADGRKVQSVMGKMNYDVNHSESYSGHYRFAKPEMPVMLEEGSDAVRIEPGYPINSPWFLYHADDGLYYRYQYGGPHLADGSQLAVKNVLFQVCSWKFYEPSEYLDINLHSGGAGMYFTNGRGIPVSWKKDGELGATRYYDQSGQEILLNPGKTWVCILLDDQLDKAGIYGE